MGVTWLGVARSTSGAIPSKWGVRGWPTIYVLDHKGVIRFKDVRGEEIQGRRNAARRDGASEGRSGRSPEEGRPTRGPPAAGGPGRAPKAPGHGAGRLRGVAVPAPGSYPGSQNGWQRASRRSVRAAAQRPVFAQRVECVVRTGRREVAGFHGPTNFW